MPAFRFDADRHAYVDTTTQREYPHVTGLLKAGGWVDDRWFTEQSRERGSAVHRAAMEVDLGLRDLEDLYADYGDVVHGHVTSYRKALDILQAHVVSIEEAIVHPVFLYAGTLDRRVIVGQRNGIVEIKTGARERTLVSESGYRGTAHHLQTALQAILASTLDGTPEEDFVRIVIYTHATGKIGRIEDHPDRRDLDEAHRLRAGRSRVHGSDVWLEGHSYAR